jgi:hypothetical protein
MVPERTRWATRRPLDGDGRSQELKNGFNKRSLTAVE